MARGQNAEVHATLPERIVVIAVPGLHADRRDPLGQLTELGVGGGHFRHRVADLTGNGDGLEAQFVDRIIQFGDGLFRGPGGDHRGRGHAVLHLVEHLRIKGIERSRQNLAHFLVAHLIGGNAVGGVDDGEVDTGILQPLGVELRQHAGRAVDGVFARRRRPEHGAMVFCVARASGFFELFGNLRAADVADVIHDRPFAFENMGIGFDDRVVEPFLDRGGLAVESMDFAHCVLPLPTRQAPANPSGGVNFD